MGYLSVCQLSRGNLKLYAGLGFLFYALGIVINDYEE